MNSFFKTLVSNEKGSQLIEQCFVFPVFLMLVVGFFDVSRFLTTETLLTKGAYDAAMLASRLPNVDTDISELDPDSNAYKRFQISRRMIIEEARKLPIATIVGEAGSVDPVRLMNFRMTDQAASDQTGVYDAALIRPAECALVEDEEDRSMDVSESAPCGSSVCNDESCIKHPVVPPKSDGSSYNTNQKNLMENQLMMVVLKSEVEMMIPGLGNMQAQGIGIARRQSLPFSPFERAVEGSEEYQMSVDYDMDPVEPVEVEPRAPVARPVCDRNLALTCSSSGTSIQTGVLTGCTPADCNWVIAFPYQQDT